VGSKDAAESRHRGWHPDGIRRPRGIIGAGLIHSHERVLLKEIGVVYHRCLPVTVNLIKSESRLDINISYVMNYF